LHRRTDGALASIASTYGGCDAYVRLEEDYHSARGGRRVSEQLEPFTAIEVFERGKPVQLRRDAQIRNQTNFDRIGNLHEYDREQRRSPLSAPQALAVRPQAAHRVPLHQFRRIGL